MASRPLSDQLLIQMHSLMVKARLLEERCIKIYKSGGAYFWIGGPGEEAFGVPLALLAHKGQGLFKDWFHLHYRCTPTLVGLGMESIDALRLMMGKKTDPFTGGRNFSSHYCVPRWNVVPVTSPIEVQYSLAIGTAHAQRRSSSQGITIVTGGDAGTAEGDFASCLVWASRPKKELPLLITVQNNRWGISTAYEGQHGEERISHRGQPFGIKTESVDGNDPIAVYLSLKENMDYIRKNRKPVLMEFQVSRLYGHSSADGANFRDEECCLKKYEKKLKGWKVLTESHIKKVYETHNKEILEAYEKVKKEADPCVDSVWDHVYAGNENADWRKF